MGWRRQRLTGWVGVAAVVSLAACSGGAANSVGDVDDRDGEQQEESTSTTAERDESGDALGPGSVPTSFRASGTAELVGFRTEMTSVVADSRSYSEERSAEGFTQQLVRVGPSTWVRSSATDVIDQELWEEVDSDLLAPLASLAGLLESPPPLSELDLTATDLVGQAFIDLAFTDPASLLGDAAEDLPEGESEPEVELPPEVTEVLGELGLDEPELDVAVVVDDGLLRELSMELSDPGVELEVDVTYDGHGEVDGSDVEPPPAGEVDPTPWLHEEEITAWTDTPLLVPAAVPGDLVLVEALVLDPSETLEGCQQVSLFYAPPGDEPFPERFLSIFLLPKFCATAFDPAEFTETVGGHLARFGGYEVLVDNTVVQLAPSEDLFPELDALAASLGPVDAPTLIALVE